MSKTSVLSCFTCALFLLADYAPSCCHCRQRGRSVADFNCQFETDCFHFTMHNRAILSVAFKRLAVERNGTHPRRHPGKPLLTRSSPPGARLGRAKNINTCTLFVAHSASAMCRDSVAFILRRYTCISLRNRHAARQGENDEPAPGSSVRWLVLLGALKY